jgi:flagellar motor switch protein FliN/FliY
MKESGMNAAKGGLRPVAQPIDYPELAADDGSGKAILAQSTRLLDSIAVPLSVVVGNANLSLGELMALKEAQVLKVDRLVDQAVDIVVNGTVVARGELVVVDEHFGVRVTEVAKQQG